MSVYIDEVTLQSKQEEWLQQNGKIDERAVPILVYEHYTPKDINADKVPKLRTYAESNATVKYGWRAGTQQSKP